MACAEILICFYSMVRPCSFLVHSTKQCWVFGCTQGKRRVGASRLPFLWTLPVITVICTDVMPKIVEAQAKPKPELKKEKPFEPPKFDTFLYLKYQLYYQ